MKYLLPPQPGAPAREFVYFSCRRPGCGNFVSRAATRGLVSLFVHARQSNIYGARVVFHYGVRTQVQARTWAHTHIHRVCYVPRGSRRFFEGSGMAY